MLDRISGKKTVDSDRRGAYVFVNGRFLHETSHGYVVADRSGHWSAASRGLHTSGDIEGKPLPGEETLATISILASIEPFTFPRLKEELPLLPRSEVSQHQDDRDRHIREAHDSLDAIVQLPRTRLRRDMEVVPIGRVRRVTPRSMIHLAAHSEHWGRRTVSRVEPSRMLAEFAEEDLDFYENRVIAEAVRRSAELLDRRIRKIGDVADFFESLERLSRRLMNRPHRVTKRISEQFKDLEGGLDPTSLKVILKDLVETRALIGQVMDSSFMGRVQRLGGGPERLFWTNILVDDARYRVAGTLLEDLSKEPTRTPEEFARASRESCSEWVAYAVLATVRALEDLGWTAHSETTLCRSAAIPLSRSCGRGMQSGLLRWDLDDTIVIEAQGNPTRSIRLIPLLQPLQAIQSETAAVRTWTALRADALERDDDMVLLLYPRDAGTTAAWPDHVHRHFNSLGYELVPPTRVGLLPIGPLEADTVERLARALGWLSRGWLFTDSYPVGVSASRKDCEVIATLFPRAVFGGSKDHLELRQCLAPEEIQTVLEEAKRAAKQRRPGAPEPDHDQHILEALDSASGRLELLLTCPLCQSRVSTRGFEARDDSTFWASCSNCETQWGTRTCKACLAKYPVLSPPGVDLETEPFRPDWIEHYLGSESSTAPCARRNRDFLCPNCGVCTGSENSTPCEGCRPSAPAMSSNG